MGITAVIVFAAISNAAVVCGSDINVVLVEVVDGFVRIVICEQPFFVLQNIQHAESFFIGVLDLLQATKPSISYIQHNTIWWNNNSKKEGVGGDDSLFE